MRAVVLGGLILLAAASAVAQDEVVTPAPAPPDAVPKPAAAVPTMESVAEARRSGKYQEALDGARLLAARDPPPEPKELHRLALIEAESCLYLERHEEALLAADRCLGLLHPEGKNWEPWVARASSARAWALVGCGRTADAATTLDELVRRLPAQEAELGTLRLRALIKVGDGILVDADYRGKWKDDTRIAAGLKRLKAGVGLAVDRLRDRVGDSGLPLPPVVVRVEDVDENLKSDVGDPLRMDTSVVRRGVSDVGLVTVSAMMLLGDGAGEVAALSHELVHVLLLQGRREPGLPPWVNEGLAEWVQDDNEQDLWDWLSRRSSLAGDARTILKLPGAGDYPKPWEERPKECQRVLGKVLFHYLERTRGRGAVRGFARTLMTTKADSGVAFRSAFGGSPGELHAELEKEFTPWARKGLPPQATPPAPGGNGGK
jgi:hypothetical protein